MAIYKPNKPYYFYKA